MPKNTVGYVDGYVLVITKKNVDAYRKMARDAGKIWIKHGALSYRECIGDDLAPDTGPFRIMPFPTMTKAKKGETVWFSYIEYRNKRHRDQVNARVMKDMAMQSDDPDHMEKMPFDMKRMAWGGFKVSVGLE